jgi:sugar (pentulose or hexulose) kinase
VRCADALTDHPPANVFQGPGPDANRFWQMSFSSTSANLLEWYRNSLPGKPGFEELTQLAIAAPASDLIIEPYGDHGAIAASFRHVRDNHTPGQVVRAIMQRVAQSLRDQVQTLCGADLPPEIRSAGGAARNDYWLQMKADTLGIPLVAMECEEPTSLGAAMLAGRAMGLGSLPELASKWCRPRARFTPKT